jgi:hypothetical protein
VGFVSEARWSRAARALGVVMFAEWIIAVVLSGLAHQLSTSNFVTSAG